LATFACFAKNDFEILNRKDRKARKENQIANSLCDLGVLGRKMPSPWQTRPIFSDLNGALRSRTFF